MLELLKILIKFLNCKQVIKNTYRILRYSQLKQFLRFFNFDFINLVVFFSTIYYFLLFVISTTSETIKRLHLQDYKKLKISKFFETIKTLDEYTIFFKKTYLKVLRF